MTYPAKYLRNIFSTSTLKITLLKFLRSIEIRNAAHLSIGRQNVKCQNSSHYSTDFSKCQLKLGSCSLEMTFFNNIYMEIRRPRRVKSISINKTKKEDLPYQISRLIEN